MKQFDYYEFAGVLAPGAVVVYGLARIYPALGILSVTENVSFGELGLILILAYVAGHLIQAFGNFIEWAWWKGAGGKPTDWIRVRKRNILAEAQWNTLPTKIQSQLGLNCPNRLSDISPADWAPITRQVYAAVRKDGRNERVDIFNGNYGMFRGIAASLVLILVVLLSDVESNQLRLYFALATLTLLALFRMHRFAVYYARELFVQFLEIEPRSKT